jgi:hypothetical protein
VVATKLAGARLLDAATAGEPLDFFAVSSSTAAFLGMPGQSDYAAANRALAAFAAARDERVRAGERHGASRAIAWSLWEAGGMVIEQRNRAALRTIQGMTAMPSPQGLAVLEAAIRGTHPAVMTVWGDQERIRSYVAERMADGKSSGPAAGDPARADRTDTEQFLLDLVCDTVKLPRGGLAPDEQFTAIGVDSVLIRRLAAALEERLGPLPATLFFECRTVREVCARLAETHPAQLRGLAGQPAPAIRPAPAIIAADPPDDAIAIIGLAGRYPGGADLEEFWNLLAAGRDAITEIPADRWDHAQYFTPGERHPGSTYGKWGGFLRGVACFDALYFGIPPSEAEKLDPNERLFLEVAWSAIEDAGYSRRLLHQLTDDGGGSHSVGVFVGVTGTQYQLLGAEEWGRGNRVSAFSLDFSVANRLSYFLDAHGPSMVVDTACSASLTALHLACESLRRGECRVAIAGGTHINLHPMKYVLLSDMRLLSSDGRCHAFGADGDGFVPGRGWAPWSSSRSAPRMPTGTTSGPLSARLRSTTAGRRTATPCPPRGPRARWCPRRCAAAGSRHGPSATSRRTAPGPSSATLSRWKVCARHSATTRKRASSARSGRSSQISGTWSPRPPSPG